MRRLKPSVGSRAREWAGGAGRETYINCPRGRVDQADRALTSQLTGAKGEKKKKTRTSMCDLNTDVPTEGSLPDDKFHALPGSFPARGLSPLAQASYSPLRLPAGRNAAEGVTALHHAIHDRSTKTLSDTPKCEHRRQEHHRSARKRLETSEIMATACTVGVTRVTRRGETR